MHGPREKIILQFTMLWGEIFLAIRGGGINFDASRLLCFNFKELNWTILCLAYPSSTWKLTMKKKKIFQNLKSVHDFL